MIKALVNEITTAVADSGIPPEIQNRLKIGVENTDNAQTNIINYILYVAGLTSVVMIIVSGVKMTTSAGNAGAVQSAKKTLTYSIVGLAVTVLAYAIVNFVIGHI